MIPTLTTPRLTLRPHRMAEFDAYAAMLATDRARYLDGVKTRAEAWAWFTADVAHWPLFGYGSLVVDLTETGATLGHVGLGRGIDFPETELGWLLFEGHEGRGYATEAARALRDWGLAHAGLTSLVSYIDPDNLPSRRLAERLGAVVDPDAARPNNDPCLVYRHRVPA
jgi:RimJ/RimL family protein N-acetyltransferase